MVGRNRKNVFGVNGRLTLMGGNRITPMPEGMTYEDMAKSQLRSVPDDGDRPFTEKLGTDIGYAFSLKYTVNKERTAHHIILEYLQMRTFQGQTFDIRSHELVKKYTALTFPNIAYRVEF